MLAILLLRFSFPFPSMDIHSDNNVLDDFRFPWPFVNTDGFFVSLISMRPGGLYLSTNAINSCDIIEWRSLLDARKKCASELTVIRGKQVKYDNCCVRISPPRFIQLPWNIPFPYIARALFLPAFIGSTIVQAHRREVF